MRIVHHSMGNDLGAHLMTKITWIGIVSKEVIPQPLSPGGGAQREKCINHAHLIDIIILKDRKMPQVCIFVAGCRLAGFEVAPPQLGPKQPWLSWGVPQLSCQDLKKCAEGATFIMGTFKKVMLCKVCFTQGSASELRSSEVQFRLECAQHAPMGSILRVLHGLISSKSGWIRDSHAKIQRVTSLITLLMPIGCLKYMWDTRNSGGQIRPILFGMQT